MPWERRSMKSLSRSSPPCRVARSANHRIADSCEPIIVPNPFARNEFHDRQRLNLGSGKAADIPCRPALRLGECRAAKVPRGPGANPWQGPITNRFPAICYDSKQTSHERRKSTYFGERHTTCFWQFPTLPAASQDVNRTDRFRVELHERPACFPAPANGVDDHASRHQCF
jgi:hypothetical protein